MVTHSSILAWKIPWTEKPGKLQSMGSLLKLVALPGLWMGLLQGQGGEDQGLSHTKSCKR